MAAPSSDMEAASASLSLSEPDREASEHSSLTLTAMRVGSTLTLGPAEASPGDACEALALYFTSAQQDALIMTHLASALPRCVCVCVSVCVCVCLCVCVRERERERVECVCACVYEWA